jgi:hypothetical protein
VETDHRDGGERGRERERGREGGTNVGLPSSEPVTFDCVPDLSLASSPSPSLSLLLHLLEQLDVQ